MGDHSVLSMAHVSKCGRGGGCRRETRRGGEGVIYVGLVGEIPGGWG